MFPRSCRRRRDAISALGAGVARRLCSASIPIRAFRYSARILRRAAPSANSALARAADRAGADLRVVLDEPTGQAALQTMLIQVGRWSTLLAGAAEGGAISPICSSPTILRVVAALACPPGWSCANGKSDRGRFARRDDCSPAPERATYNPRPSCSPPAFNLEDPRRKRVRRRIGFCPIVANGPQLKKRPARGFSPFHASPSSRPELLGEGFRNLSALPLHRCRAKTMSSRTPHDPDPLRTDRWGPPGRPRRADEGLVLIRQFRLPAQLANGNGDMVEIVAGHVEADEKVE